MDSSCLSQKGSKHSDILWIPSSQECDTRARGSPGTSWFILPAGRMSQQTPAGGRSCISSQARLQKGHRPEPTSALTSSLHLPSQAMAFQGSLRSSQMVQNYVIFFFPNVLYGRFESTKRRKIVKVAQSKHKASSFKFTICSPSKSPDLICLPFSLGTTAPEHTLLA